MLQRNQIYCMDALDLLRALDPQSVDMVLCDLPYGVTANKWDVIIPLEPMWEELKRVTKKNAAIVLTAMQPFSSMLVMSNLKMFRYEWIWCKPNGTNFLQVNFKPYGAHEQVLVFYQKTPIYNPQMTEGASYTIKRQNEALRRNLKKKRGITENTETVNLGTRYPKSWQMFAPETFFKNESELANHPTQKPVALFEYLIKTYTQEGDLVVDMTCGSGTTAIAARKWNRDFICGDNSEEYVDMARRRLATSDPYQDKPMKDGRKQLSLFSGEDT